MEQWTVALLTDFGAGSEYVGMMKGALLRALGAAAGAAAVVDLCHTVAPQAVVSGAWLLRAAQPHFPARTVFLGVVDPGVGTARRAVAVFPASPGGPVFVGPDNGLLGPAVAAASAAAAGTGFVVAVLATAGAASRTFHGRDVFAPAAAAAVRCCGDHGAFAAALGAQGVEGWASADSLVALDIDSHVVEGTSGDGCHCGVRGVVVRVDRYGNVVTSAEMPRRVWVGGWDVRCESESGLALDGLRLCRTYAEGAPGELLVLVGSSGTLELSVRDGDASQTLASAQIRLGSKITFHFSPK